MSGQSEKDLLADLSSSGGKEGPAFTVLYRKYSGKCFSFINSLTKDPEVSRDIVHDIFVKVWLRRDIIPNVDSFSSYLFRMAKNAVLDHYDSNTINRKYVAHQLLFQEEFRAYVEEKANLDELQLLIWSAVGSMPEQRRRIFIMSRYNGIPNAEIAAVLGINVRTVENHITNALADIRAALGRV